MEGRGTDERPVSAKLGPMEERWEVRNMGWLGRDVGARE